MVFLLFLSLDTADFAVAAVVSAFPAIAVGANAVDAVAVVIAYAVVLAFSFS
jgi:hypothetical protein